MSSSAETFRTAATAIADQIVDATCEEGRCVLADGRRQAGRFGGNGSLRPPYYTAWPGSRLPPRGLHVLRDRRYQELALAGLKWAGANATS